MDVLEVAFGTRDQRVPEYMWLFCLSTHRDSFKLPCCPILSLRVRLGHVSSVDNMTDRRYLFFIDREINTIFGGVCSPLMIKVETASYLEVHILAFDK